MTEETPFDRRTKIAGYLFRALEGTLVRFSKELGEELFCICKAETA